MIMNNSAWETYLERATQEKEKEDVSEVTVDPNKKSREQGKKEERGWQTMEEAEKKRPIISARERESIPPKSRGSRLKCITIENKSKSSIWKSSETMQLKPKSGGCAILLLGAQFVASFSPPSSSASIYSLSGPGPGRYSLPPTVGYVNHDFTKPRSAAYTFHSRMNSAMVAVDSSPGPGYHIDANVTRFGRMETPSYSISGRGSRTRSKDDSFQTPGPGAYSPERAPPLNGHRRPPSHTIGARTRYRSVDPVPAPNSYSLPNLLGHHIPHKPSSASYSFSSRRKVGAPAEDLAATPGPGKYNSTNPDIYHNRQPSFTMQGRTKRPNYSFAIPGPGTYSPERFHVHRPRPPSFTLGIRHSEFVTPLVVNVTD